MMLLIAEELRRFRKGNHDDRDVAPVKFSFGRCHLAEVSLTGKSSKMPEKN